MFVLSVFLRYNNMLDIPFSGILVRDSAARDRLRERVGTRGIIM